MIYWLAHITQFPGFQSESKHIVQVDKWEAVSNIASSSACILATSTLEQVPCPSFETIREMVMSPICLQLFILGLLPGQAVTE